MGSKRKQQRKLPLLPFRSAAVFQQKEASLEAFPLRDALYLLYVLRSAVTGCASRAASTAAAASPVLFVAVYASCGQYHHKKNRKANHHGSYIFRDPSKHCSPLLSVV